jgi:uncharacterized protein
MAVKKTSRDGSPSRLFFCALLAAAWLPAAVCHAASFDCRQASSQTEQLICADPALSRLDEDLNALYRRTLAAHPSDKDVLRVLQRAWLQSEADQCGTAACLQDAFRARMAMLEQLAPAGDPAAAWNGRYVRFQNGKPDKNSATLAIAGLSGGRLAVSGNAVWVAEDGPDGQVNTGELYGIGRIGRGAARFKLEGCSATMRLSGAALVVEDESGCGGNHVSFDGAYRRK